MQECAAALETFEDEIFSLAWADRHCCYAAFGDGKARKKRRNQEKPSRPPTFFLVAEEARSYADLTLTFTFTFTTRRDATRDALSICTLAYPQVRLWDTRCGRTAYPGYDGSPRGPCRCIQLQDGILACGGGRGECAGPFPSSPLRLAAQHLATPRSTLPPPQPRRSPAAPRCPAAARPGRDTGSARLGPARPRLALAWLPAHLLVLPTAVTLHICGRLIVWPLNGYGGGGGPSLFPFSQAEAL